MAKTETQEVKKAEEVKPEKVKEQTEAVFDRVPSQYEDVIKLPDGSYTDEAGLLVLIYNKLLKIEKSVA